MRHFATVWVDAFHRSSRAALVSALVVGATLLAAHAHAQCSEQGPFQYYTGGIQGLCPCFAPGEQAGVVFTLPAAEYPIEIMKVGIAWFSQFGGSGQTLEEAIHVYAGGLPNPGPPIFTLPGPQLTDGVINEFNLGVLPGEIRVESGPFTVTLEFQNPSDPFAPTIAYDNGCQAGKNVVFAIPGGWTSACALGVPGDWVFYVKYRSLKVTAQKSPAQVVFSNIPVNQTTCDTVFVANTGCDTLLIDGISGCGAAPFSIDTTMTAHAVVPGGQTMIKVCATPTSANPANCTLTVASNASNAPTTFAVSIDGVTAVGGAPPGDGFAVLGVVPNPFNPATTIRFRIPGEMAVTAEVWSVSGERVATLARDRVYAAGDNELRWNGRSTAGAPVASGVYLVRITTPLGARVARAILLK
jgi:hypothetical protein